MDLPFRERGPGRRIKAAQLIVELELRPYCLGSNYIPVLGSVNDVSEIGPPDGGTRFCAGVRDVERIQKRCSAADCKPLAMSVTFRHNSVKLSTQRNGVELEFKVSEQLTLP